MTSKMRKIICVISARASYARFREALIKLQGNIDIDLGVVLSASAASIRYGDLESQLSLDGLKCLGSAECLIDATGNTMAKTTALALIELTNIFQAEKPELVITIADRFETLATSIAAAYSNIPLLHIQGGEITGNIDELVRHANSKLSKFHIVSTDRSKARLLQMGEQPSNVFTTGCPSIDIARKSKTIDDDELQQFIRSQGIGIDLANPYIVCQLHPETETHIDTGVRTDLLLNCIKESGYPCILMWPNSDAGNLEQVKRYGRVRDGSYAEKFFLLNNIRAEFFLKLVSKSEFIIGNSSVGIRECSYLGVPAINIGYRQNGRERASNVLDVTWDESAIMNAIRQVRLNRKKYSSSNSLYGDGYSSEKIAAKIKLIMNAPDMSKAKQFYDA